MARHNRDAAAYSVPGNPPGPISRRGAGLTLRPSQVPARLVPEDELRADMQAKLSGNPFAARGETSQMEAQSAQPPAQQEGINSLETLGLLSHVQPKLMVGQVNDPLEDEADRVADQVMRIPEPQIAVVSPQISRECSSCGEEEDEEAQQLQAKRAASGAAAGDAPAVVTALLQSPGRPLEAGARGFMEPRLGHDLSGVRIHTGPLASRSAGAVMARAYTVGRNVVFRHGEYAPGTTEGRRLLAHELAHVLQQRPANPAPKTLRPSQVTAVGSRLQRQDDAPQPDTSSVDYNAGYQDATTRGGQPSPGDRSGQTLTDYNAGFAAGLAAGPQQDVNAPPAPSPTPPASASSTAAPQPNSSLVDQQASQDTSQNNPNTSQDSGDTGQESQPQQPEQGDQPQPSQPGPAGAEADRVAGLWSAFAGWLAEGDYEDAAEVLNAFNADDINARLATLSSDQIAQIEQGGMRNPRVGPNAQVVALCAAYMQSHANTTGSAEVPAAPSDPFQTARSFAEWIELALQGKELLEKLGDPEEIKTKIDALKTASEKADPENEDFWKVIDTIETAAEFDSPVGYVFFGIKALLDFLSDLTSGENAVRTRAWCYTVLYGSLGMGVPAKPRFGGGDLPSQNELNSDYWDKGVNEGLGQLEDGTDGVELMNKMFLLVAEHGDGGAVLNALWHKACEKIAGGNSQRMLYPELPWPTPPNAGPVPFSG